MDLWVVKYASRRSRIGDFSGDSSVRGARIRAFWPLGESSGKRASTSGGANDRDDDHGHGRRSRPGPVALRGAAQNPCRRHVLRHRCQLGRQEGVERRLDHPGADQDHQDAPGRHHAELGEAREIDRLQGAEDHEHGAAHGEHRPEGRADADRDRSSRADPSARPASAGRRAPGRSAGRDAR